MGRVVGELAHPAALELRRAVDAPAAAPPRVSSWWLRIAGHYAERYAARGLHAVRRSRAGGVPDLGTTSAVVYLNHPSWWDPLVLLIVAQKYWPDRRHFAPIDAAALGRYRILESLGFFGIERGTVAGARRFTETTRGILAEPQTVLWLTPQGRFADPRERPAQLESGLAWLARRAAPDVSFVPLALEYPFWEERTAECLLRFGPVLKREEIAAGNAVERSQALAVALEATQDRLAEEARTRRAGEFETLVQGAAGVGGVYDLWRRLKAQVRGARFRSEHGGSE
jgi:1-acyl-sn-glycerol-3-phosphate acyltransferase